MYIVRLIASVRHGTNGNHTGAGHLFSCSGLLGRVSDLAAHQRTSGARDAVGPEILAESAEIAAAPGGNGIGVLEGSVHP